MVGRVSRAHRLRATSGRELVAFLERAGFRARRRKRGSHIVLVGPGGHRVVPVPDHRELKRGTLRAVLRQAGFSVDEFLQRPK